MKNLAFVIILLFAGCDGQSIFVWTIGDIIGMIFIGLILLVGAFIGILNLIDSLRKRYYKK